MTMDALNEESISNVGIKVSPCRWSGRNSLKGELL